MIITNKEGLPQPIFDLIKNKTYSKGDSDISITELLQPARLRALQKAHDHEIEQDASEMIWSLVGTLFHGNMERVTTTGISEQRFFMDVLGWKVSGQIDRFENGKISDFKFVTSYKFKGDGVSIEYEQQLNCYAELLRRNGHDVKEIEIVGVLRDWSKMEAKRDANYPQKQVLLRKVPLWTSEDCVKFLESKVKSHQDAMTVLPECSPEERWEKKTVYAVMKGENKKALKLFDTKEEAETLAYTHKDARVVTRLGESTRCEFYCGVKSFCEQYKQTKMERQDKHVQF